MNVIDRHEIFIILCPPFVYVCVLLFFFFIGNTEGKADYIDSNLGNMSDARETLIILSLLDLCLTSERRKTGQNMIW